MNLPLLQKELERLQVLALEKGSPDEREFMDRVLEVSMEECGCQKCPDCGGRTDTPEECECERCPHCNGRLDD